SGTRHLPTPGTRTNPDLRLLHFRRSGTRSRRVGPPPVGQARPGARTNMATATAVKQPPTSKARAAGGIRSRRKELVNVDAKAVGETIPTETGGDGLTRPAVDPRVWELHVRYARTRDEE